MSKHDDDDYYYDEIRAKDSNSLEILVAILIFLYILGLVIEGVSRALENGITQFGIIGMIYLFITPVLAFFALRALVLGTIRAISLAFLLIRELLKSEMDEGAIKASVISFLRMWKNPIAITIVWFLIGQIVPGAREFALSTGGNLFRSGLKILFDLVGAFLALIGSAITWIIDNALPASQ